MNVTEVDSKGRIVLPQTVRERLGITPGTVVEIRVDDGTAVVEPEDDPQQIIDRMEHLVEKAASKREQTAPLPEDPDPLIKKHRDAIRRGAETNSDE